MAEEWLVRDQRLGPKVALEVLCHDALGQAPQRFRFEARDIARFTHPHPLALHATGEGDFGQGVRPLSVEPFRQYFTSDRTPCLI